MARLTEEWIGRRVHSLTVLREVRNPQRSGRFFVCACECGGERIVYVGHLNDSTAKSCGCVKGAHRTHSMSGTPEYKAWDGARSRCSNPSNRKYPLYGGRGIRMADDWMRSFEAFFAAVGPRPGPGYSLDREDNDRGYEPGNVRWATASQQNINRRPHRAKVMGVRRVTSG